MHVHRQVCNGVEELLEDQREFCEGVRAPVLSMMCAPGDSIYSVDSGFNCEAGSVLKVMYGLGGVVSTSACLYQVATFVRHARAARSPTNYLVLDLRQVDSTSACPQSRCCALACSCGFSSACHRLTHPEYFNCPHISTCCLVFNCEWSFRCGTSLSYSCFVHPCVASGEERYPDCEDAQLLHPPSRCLRCWAEVFQIVAPSNAPGRSVH